MIQIDKELRYYSKRNTSKQAHITFMVVEINEVIHIQEILISIVDDTRFPVFIHRLGNRSSLSCNYRSLFYECYFSENKKWALLEFRIDKATDFKPIGLLSITKNGSLVSHSRQQNFCGFIEAQLAITNLQRSPSQIAHLEMKQLANKRLL